MQDDNTTQNDQPGDDMPSMSPGYPPADNPVPAAPTNQPGSMPPAALPPVPSFSAPSDPPAEDSAALDNLVADDTNEPADHDLPSAPPPAPAPALDDPAPADDLISIKQQALGQLSPLVDHLEQTAEEKFKTTMMMIQAADNRDLIKTAYAAAQAITDDKAKAQALLDIINEINYFTQNDNKD